jgi:hypothetical protein
MYVKQYCITLVLLTAIITGCNNNIPDVSNIKVDLKAVDYYQQIAKLDSNNCLKGILDLDKQYPQFTKRYTYDLLGYHLIPSDTATTLQRYLKHFTSYKDYVNLQKTVATQYPNTSAVTKDLTQLIQYIKYYIPQYKVPQLYYFVSGLNYFSTITDDSIIGVGLDMFLGKDYEFYPALQFPQYQIERFIPQQISPMMAKTIYEEIFPFTPDGKDLLTLMIRNGQQLYFMDKVLPYTTDDVKMGYTPTQLEWCKQFEDKVWNFFVSNELLYKSDFQKVLKYVMDGPSTSGLPIESPGNIGSWVGWQIVKKYMDKHPDISLQKLCSQSIPAQQILEQSGYKPR